MATPLTARNAEIQGLFDHIEDLIDQSEHALSSSYNIRLTPIAHGIEQKIRDSHSSTLNATMNTERTMSQKGNGGFRCFGVDKRGSYNTGEKPKTDPKIERRKDRILKNTQKYGYIET